MKRRTEKFRAGLLVFIMAVCVFATSDVFASAAKIDRDVDRALELFNDIKGSDNVLTQAKGLLVFPAVIKAGLGIGGEYGEGALRVDGKTVDYYNTVSASIGFQLGVQKKTVVIAFLDENSLRRFRDSSGWEIGVDASVALIAIGAGGSIDSTSLNEPIVGVVFGQKGLMYNVTLEGTKITRIRKN